MSDHFEWFRRQHSNTRVPSVPRVPNSESASELKAFSSDARGTQSNGTWVPRVPNSNDGSAQGTQGTHACDRWVPDSAAENALQTRRFLNQGTQGTHGTHKSVEAPARAQSDDLAALPSHPYERAKIVARYCEVKDIDLSTFLNEYPDLIQDDGSAQESPARPPAESIIATCQRYGVALRIDPETGDLVVGRADAQAGEPTQPWPSLLVAIEAHLEAVAALVEAGWTINHPLPATQYVH